MYYLFFLSLLIILNHCILCQQSLPLSSIFVFTSYNMHTSYQVLRLNTTPKNWEANPNCIQLFLAFLTNFDHMVAWSCHGSKITKKLVGKASNHWHAKSGNPLFSFHLFYSFQNYLLKGTWSHHGSYSPVTYLKVTWSPEAAMDLFSAFTGERTDRKSVV
jgi:hypothetical protein